MGKLSGGPLKQATKAALGLAKAYRMDAVAAMRLVARAAQGDTATLAKYGIKLGEGLSAQEKFNKVMEIGAKNYKLVEAEADTYVVKVQQMKNALSDLKEKIGEGLMPVFKAWAERITKWATDNNARIGEWAAKTVSYVGLVKDVFASFINYMRSDWQSGLQYVLDSFLDMLGATFRAAVTLAIAAGEGIYAGIKEALLGRQKHKIEVEVFRRYRDEGGPVREVQGISPSWGWGKTSLGTKEFPVDLERMAEIRADVEADFRQQKTESILGNTLKKIAADFKKTLKGMLLNAPAELGKAWAEDYARLVAKLEAIGKDSIKYGSAAAREEREETPAGEEAVKALVDKGRQVLQPKEARFLTFAPGTKFGTEEQIAKNTKESVDVQEQILATMKATDVYPPFSARIVEAAELEHFKQTFRETLRGDFNPPITKRIIERTREHVEQLETAPPIIQPQQELHGPRVGREAESESNQRTAKNTTKANSHLAKLAPLLKEVVQGLAELSHKIENSSGYSVTNFS